MKKRIRIFSLSLISCILFSSSCYAAECFLQIPDSQLRVTFSGSIEEVRSEKLLSTEGVEKSCSACHQDKKSLYRSTLHSGQSGCLAVTTNDSSVFLSHCLEPFPSFILSTEKTGIYAEHGQLTSREGNAETNETSEQISSEFEFTSAQNQILQHSQNLNIRGKLQSKLRTAEFQSILHYNYNEPENQKIALQTSETTVLKYWLLKQLEEQNIKFSKVSEIPDKLRESYQTLRESASTLAEITEFSGIFCRN